MTTSPQSARVYEADPVHSSVVFGVKHLGLSTFRASFGGLQGRLLVGDSCPQLEGAVRVDAVSIDGPAEFREHIVRGADFFDADNHPEIRFSSEQVEIHADQSVRVTGELTMRGVTRTVSAYGSCEAPVEDPFGTRRAALELQTTLDRREWGLDWQRPLPSGDDALGWMVDVTIHLELIEQS